MNEEQFVHNDFFVPIEIKIEGMAIDSCEKWKMEQLANTVVDCPNGYVVGADWGYIWRVNRRWFTSDGLEEYLRHEFDASQHDIAYVRWNAINVKLHVTEGPINDTWPPC